VISVKLEDAVKKISETRPSINGLGVVRRTLDREESRAVFDGIMRGGSDQDQLKQFLTSLTDPSVEEIHGAVLSMREVMLKVELKPGSTVRSEVLDIVGTGGDGKNSLNISTAAAFVAAGAGATVAKHGNYSFSSVSGAANVLEALGVDIRTTPEDNSQILSSIGIAFLFAQLHHPSMKHVAEVRRQIRQRTIFNIVGPLTNPAGASRYLLGAYSVEMAEKLAFVLAELGTESALVVHGDGYDELSLVGRSNTGFVVKGGKLAGRIEIVPEEFGFGRCSARDLEVSSPQNSAEIIKGVLRRRIKGPQRAVIELNAGAAIYAYGLAEDIKQGIALARLSIDNGYAFRKFDRLLTETTAHYLSGIN